MRGLGRIGAPIARAHSYFRNAFQAFRQHSPDKIPSSTGRIRQVAAQKHVRRYRHAWKDCHRRRHRGCGRRSRRHHQKEKGISLCTERQLTYEKTCFNPFSLPACGVALRLRRRDARADGRGRFKRSVRHVGRRGNARRSRDCGLRRRGSLHSVCGQCRLRRFCGGGGRLHAARQRAV